MASYRLAVLADIHGNLPACEAVMQDLKQYAPLDAILVAGDVIGGPGQEVILQQLMDINAILIQGNGEQRIARLADGSAPDYYYSAHQYALPRWAHDHLSDKQRVFLCGLPEQRVFSLPGADPIRMVHGSPRKVDELILPNLDCHPNLYYKPVLLGEVIDLVAEPVIVFGHTHLQWQSHSAGKLTFNPGAVNFPEDDYLGAQYAILDWDGNQWHPTFYRVSYDMACLQRDYQESGFLDVSPLARVILYSVLTGKDYLPIYFQHVRKVATEIGHATVGFYPDDVWDWAETTFPWDTWNM